MKSLCLSLIVCTLALLGCGSQQLRLTSPDTAAGVSYTCTAANTCYPASLAIPAEGQLDDALPLTMPPECQGRIHEILIRDPGSSSPEIDVTCAGPAAKPDAPAQTTPAPSTPSDEPPVVEDSSIAPSP